MKEVILLLGVSLLFIPIFLTLILGFRNNSLSIDMEYVKDPFYFGNSFRKKISDVIFSSTIINKNLVKAKLSREELIVFGKINFINSVVYRNCVYVSFGENHIRKGTYFEKEILSTGNLYIGEDSVLRAVASNADIFLGKGVHIVRWIDAQGSIQLGEDCILGISSASKKEIKLAKGVRFTRMFGFPVCTNKNRIKNPSREIRENRYGKEVVIHADESLLIVGDIFADEKIELKNVKVIGNIFCHGDVYLENVEVGDENSYFSVIGNKVFISGNSNVSIFGYIQAGYLKGFVV